MMHVNDMREQRSHHEGGSPAKEAKSMSGGPHGSGQVRCSHCGDSGGEAANFKSAEAVIGLPVTGELAIGGVEVVKGSDSVPGVELSKGTDGVSPGKEVAKLKG